MSKVRFSAKVEGILTMALLPVFLLVCRGGGGPTDDNEPPEFKQLYLFEVEYINFAWGFIQGGYYIDSLGDVSEYSHSQELWQSPHPDSLTYEDLHDKFALRKPRNRIDPDEIRKYLALAEKASTGTLSLPQNVCQDAGGTIYRVYLYDEESEIYTPVVLYVAGDWAQKNPAPEADTLFRWLHRVIYGNDNEPECGCQE